MILFTGIGSMFWAIIIGLVAIWHDVVQATDDATYEIRGQIAISNDPGWQTRTRISAGFGEYFGYAQQNGSFVIPNVKPGMIKLVTHKLPLHQFCLI